MPTQATAKSRSLEVGSFGERVVDAEASPSSELLTVQDVARRLKCSRALIYVLCEKGQLRHHWFGVGRGTIRVSESDLELFLQAAHVEPQRVAPASPVVFKHIRLPVRGSR